jgi:hypothetical protein
VILNEGGFLSLEQFQDKYGIISIFLEYNGLLKAIPMKFKEVIAVNNKLEKVCDRYVTVLNNTLKPTKPFYKMILEKHYYTLFVSNVQPEANKTDMRAVKK